MTRIYHASLQKGEEIVSPTAIMSLSYIDDEHVRIKPNGVAVASMLWQQPVAL